MSELVRQLKEVKKAMETICCFRDCNKCPLDNGGEDCLLTEIENRIKKEEEKE